MYTRTEKKLTKKTAEKNWSWLNRTFSTCTLQLHTNIQIVINRFSFSYVWLTDDSRNKHVPLYSNKMGRCRLKLWSCVERALLKQGDQTWTMTHWKAVMSLQTPGFYDRLQVLLPHTASMSSSKVLYIKYGKVF